MAKEEQEQYRNPNLTETLIADLLMSPSSYGLPSLTSAEVASGGFAHHVYRLSSGEGRFYLKLRGYNFPQIPEIKTNPQDVVYEHKAVSLLHSLLPDNFPKVVYFNQERGLMILTDAMPNGDTLETLLNARQVSAGILKRLGKTLRSVHNQTSEVSASIREGGDHAFSATKLEHRFGYRNNPTLNSLVQELSLDIPRQIIIGDLSPKNIGVNDGGERFMFFDLEDAHRGTVIFDVGFLLGQIILHAHEDPRCAISFTESFLNGYGGKDLSQRLLKIIALGTMLYRLDSIIPHNIEVSENDKKMLIRNIEEILAIWDLERISWQRLIYRVLGRNTQ